MIKVIVAFCAGVFAGVTLMCCMFVAGKDDEHRENELNTDKSDIS